MVCVGCCPEGIPVLANTPVAEAIPTTVCLQPHPGDAFLIPSTVFQPHQGPRQQSPSVPAASLHCSAWLEFFSTLWSLFGTRCRSRPWLPPAIWASNEVCGNFSLVRITFICLFTGHFYCCLLPFVLCCHCPPLVCVTVCSDGLKNS